MIDREPSAAAGDDIIAALGCYIEERVMMPRTSRIFSTQTRIEKMRETDAAAGAETDGVAAIAREYDNCALCGLSECRTKMVHGAGNPRARLMIIGEAPGEEEDRTGLPFVGRCGELLSKMLAAIELKREDVFITNMVKCRPPGNRNPEPEELAACRGYLLRQIAAVKPSLILLLGSVAAKAVLNVDYGVSKARGKVMLSNDIRCVASYHPSFLLRQPSAKAEAWADLKLVRKLLAETDGE